MERALNATNDNLSGKGGLFEIETRDLPGGAVQTVNARELHGYLQVGRDFSNWIKDRIDRYGFVEGEDFIKVENLSSPNLASAKSRAQMMVDYHLSLDMAKEVCMVDNSEKGRAARRYFIACERRLNESPARYLADMERQMMRLIEARVEQAVSLRLSSNARVAALEYVSVRELLVEHNAVQKGRSGLNRKIGARMRAWALQTRPPVSVRRCPHSGVWLFPRDFADDFMRRHGRDLVRDHNDRQTGQGRLGLVASGKVVPWGGKSA